VLRHLFRMAHTPVVLVVEDERSVQTTLCATLTLMGFKVHSAETVEDALKILGTQHVDAVSLDVRLPDPKGMERTGLSLLAFMRKTAEYAHVPVLVFTGMPLSRQDEELVRRNHADVFYKPQPYSVLIEHLKQVLLTAQLSKSAS
jgi:DNA-binding NtrC family response regulator